MKMMRPQHFQAKKEKTVSKLRVLILLMIGYLFAWEGRMMDRIKDKYG
jgi:hypothetical protein